MGVIANVVVQQSAVATVDRGSREEESMLGGSRRKDGGVEAKVGALNGV